MAQEYLTVNHIPTKRIAQLFSKIITHPDVQHNGTTCWLWAACRTDAGYGQVRWGGRRGHAERVHRLLFAWTMKMSLPRPPVLDWASWREVDHLCRRTSCVNPVHLELVPRQVNILRGNGMGARLAVRDRCNYGHLFTPDNIYWVRGWRKCRECALVYHRDLHRKQRAAAKLPLLSPEG
jgi:hypothetical protein